MISNKQLQKELKKHSDFKLAVFTEFREDLLVSAQRLIDDSKESGVRIAHMTGEARKEGEQQRKGILAIKDTAKQIHQVCTAIVPEGSDLTELNTLNQKLEAEIDLIESKAKVIDDHLAQTENIAKLQVMEALQAENIINKK